METTTMNDRQSQAAVEPESNDQPKPPELLFIDLDLLDDNPYQPRAERDELKSAQLRESIAKQGQIQPILVRRAASRWQMISGHGRVEALRTLRKEAKTEAERRRFSRARAEERLNVSDDQMLVLGLLENIQREDISPLDCASALARLKSLRPDLQTIQDIAREVSMEPPRVKRLLRLHAAPQVIKDAVAKGTNVLIEAEPGESETEREDSRGSRDKTRETRRLDLSSALLLAQLHAYWTKNSTPDVVSSEGTADERMATLIERVLKQDWGVRRVQAAVAKLSRGETDSSDPIGSSAPHDRQEALPFKVNRKKVVIIPSRLTQMNEDQKAELKSVLEPICAQLGGDIPPPPEKGLAHWTARLRESHRLWKQLVLGCRELMRVLRDRIFKTPPPRELPWWADQIPSEAPQLPSDAGKLPPGSTQPPSTAGQLPSNGKPVALLPMGKPEPGAKPDIRQ
jgi:ParB/RepB/Spo0J family partition protein